MFTIRLQEWIHKFEVGEGTRVVRMILAVVALLALAVLYDVREYKNFSTQEAMDAAQLARNLAEGNGYTTQFIRPLSLHLVEQREIALNQRTNDFGLLKAGHPDLANPPVYPALLAGLMRVLPFDWDIARGQQFLRYQPEVLIGILNQALFFLAILLAAALARRLFDTTVAWISALIIAGTDLFWRFSVSGLSTMLLMVIFLGLVWCLVVMEQAAREARGSGAWFSVVALLTGLLLGLGTLTRYSFGWLILPVLAFLALYCSPRRVMSCLVVVLVFVVVLAPWLARNYEVSGNVLGTAAYEVAQDTPSFPADRLERSLNPDASEVTLEDYFRKLLLNVGAIFQNELPKLGGSWVTAFFLVGLMVPFISAPLGRLRVFLLLSLMVTVVAQALGRTHLSTDSPEINSENLLVLLAPLVFVYGVGMYVVLLDSLELPFPQLRHFVTGVFVLFASGPLVFLVLPPRESPLAYPPYFPPWIQQFAGWMDKKELIMSDMPWAMAWYGHRQTVWTTMNVQDKKKHDDFYAINDLQKPVHGLYLSPLTMDARFHSQLLNGPDWAWGRFVMDSLIRTNLPTGFPLKSSPAGPFLGNGHLFLTDWPRWGRPADGSR